MQKKSKTKKRVKKEAPVNIISPKLNAIIERMNKDAGTIIVEVGAKEATCEKIPFTSPMMNYCTFGGVPKGKLTEFYGPEHGGKTTTLLDIIANYQQLYPNAIILFADVENTYDEEYAKSLGVDSSKIIFIFPDGQSAEEILQGILDMVKTGDIGLWALDSIGALISNKDLDNDLDESSYAGISGPMTKFTKAVQMYMKKYGTTGIATNQERDNIGNANPYAEPKTPGGRTWKFMCSLRLRFTQGKYLDDKGKELTSNAENPSAMKIMMKVKKMKTGKPTRRIGSYTLNFETGGIDYIKDLIDVAEKYDIIAKHGAWYSIVNVDTGEIIAEKIQGQSRLFKLLDSDFNVLQQVEQLVDIKLKLK